MPWCEECAKYWAPSAANEDGTCPSCGRPMDPPKPAPVVTAKNLDLHKLAAGEGDDADEADAAAPWHFKVLLVLLVLYLGWRFWELIVG